jgi:peptidoglycan DL-endopeptidase LytE
MKITTRNRFGKLLMAASLSFTMIFSAGSMFFNANSAHAAAATTTADNVISTGMKFLGVPYKFGAKSGRTDAFDCSSFVQYSFKQNGINLPRSSRQQSQAGKFVARNQLQAGDLVFSDTNRDGVINHVSIYMGNGKLLHTYRVGIGVTVSSFAGSAWDRTYVTARRVLPDGQAPVAAQPASAQPAQVAQLPQQAAKPQPAVAPSQPASSKSADQLTADRNEHFHHGHYAHREHHDNGNHEE